MPKHEVCPVCGSPDVAFPEPWRDFEYYCRHCGETFPAPDTVLDLADVWREE